MTTDATPRPDAEPRLRADARRNRHRIITAAREVFTERGTEVPMEEVARAAGVGTGTLYRRFPDRESLLSAIARDAIGRVLDDAREISEREPDPLDALTEFLLRAADLRTVIRFFMLSPRARTCLDSEAEIMQKRNELMEVLDGLVRAAQANGSLRQDIGSGDLALILSSVLHGTQNAPDDVRQTAPARYLTLLFDALRTSPGTPLPGRPVTAADIAGMRPPRSDV